MAEKGDSSDEEPTIAEDVVVTKYKMAGEMANRKRRERERLVKRQRWRAQQCGVGLVNGFMSLTGTAIPFSALVAVDLTDTMCMLYMYIYTCILHSVCTVYMQMSARADATSWALNRIAVWDLNICMHLH